MSTGARPIFQLRENYGADGADSVGGRSFRSMKLIPPMAIALLGVRKAGAFPVIAVDLVTRRLDLSRAGGAHHVINLKNEDLAEGINRPTNGQGVDVVIECTGRPEPIVAAFPLIAKRGRLVLLGSPAESRYAEGLSRNEGDGVWRRALKFQTRQCARRLVAKWPRRQM